MREKKLGRCMVYLACALGFGVVTFAATPAHAFLSSDLQSQVVDATDGGQPSWPQWEWD